jgi:ABC-type multidrug transport system, ATPase component
MTAIKFKNVTKIFDGKKVIDDLSFDVESGTICGFLGLNGAGKTTTFKLLNGLIPATSGQIEILGQPVTTKNPSKNIKFLMDVPEFYHYMTAGEYLKFICELNDVGDISNRIREVLELIGMEKAQNKRIGTFSRGMKQRIGIGANIISNPKILLLDEPVSALDPVGRKEVFDLLEQLRGKMTILFSSHIIEDVERVSDKIIIIHEGKKIIDSSVLEMTNRFAGNKLEVECLDMNDTYRIFNRFTNDLDVGCELIDEKEILTFDTQDMSLFQQKLFKFLSQEGISIKSIKVLKPSLEDIFVGKVV